jgi:PKD repeat protein
VGQTTSSYATFLDETIDYNTDYYYRVYAYNNGGTAPIGVSDPVFLHSIPRSFDEHAPQFQSTPTRLAKVGQLYEVTLDAKSPENEPLFFSLLTGPTNMTVNATSGLVDFTPTDAQVGNIFLSFQVTNNIGRDVLSYTLFVFPPTNHPPVVMINGPYAALTGQNIQFSSVGTSDPDNNTLRYYWNFGDGSTSTDPNPIHAYGGVGDYLVSLFVNDGYGGTASAQTHAQITRPNVPPVAVVSNGPSFTVRLGETRQPITRQAWFRIFTRLAGHISAAWSLPTIRAAPTRTTSQLPWASPTVRRSSCSRFPPTIRMWQARLPLMRAVLLIQMAIR